MTNKHDDLVSEILSRSQEGITTSDFGTLGRAVDSAPFIGMNIEIVAAGTAVIDAVEHGEMDLIADGAALRPPHGDAFYDERTCGIPSGTHYRIER